MAAVGEPGQVLPGIPGAAGAPGGSFMSRPDTVAEAATPETGETFYISRRRPRTHPTAPAPLPFTPPEDSSLPPTPAFQGPRSLPLASHFGQSPASLFPQPPLLLSGPPLSDPLPKSQSLIPTGPFSRGPAFSSSTPAFHSQALKPRRPIQIKASSLGSTPHARRLVPADHFAAPQYISNPALSASPPESLSSLSPLSQLLNPCLDFNFFTCEMGGGGGGIGKDALPSLLPVSLPHIHTIAGLCHCYY